MADDSREESLTSFDPRLRVAASGLVGTLEDLLPEERVYVEKSIRSRQIEFSTGRMVARGLLRDLGFSRPVIGRDSDRVPIWPAQVKGSISHTDGACLVAVSVDASIRGVGVDVEMDQPRSIRFLERIATPAERNQWSTDEDGIRQATRIFSAKEAVYKACFPELRERWGFREVEIELDTTSGRFAMHLPTLPHGSVSGEFREHDGRIWTIARWE